MVNNRLLARITIALMVGVVALSACDTGAPPPAPATSTVVVTEAAPTVAAASISTPVPATNPTPSVASSQLQSSVSPSPGDSQSLGAPAPGGKPPRPTPTEDQAVVVTPAVVTPTQATGAAGKILADDGFRPGVNGFKFKNFGGSTSVPELTVADLLKIFGDADVCVDIKNGVCVPRADALNFLNQVNSSPTDGHCQGMAAASIAMFKGIDNPADYADGAKTAHDLQLTAKLRDLINYYFYLQDFDPVVTSYNDTQALKPSEVLDKIIASLQNGAPDPVVLGFYPGDPSDSSVTEGHAITPYAVEDRGNGIFWIDVYDNNYVSKSNLHMIVDRNQDTWSYDVAGTNPLASPEVWSGSADTHSLGIVPLSDQTGTFICPWCGNSAGSNVPSYGGVSNVSYRSDKLFPGAALLASGSTYNQVNASSGSSTTEIMLNGGGHLLLQNSKGQRIGYDGTRIINEIPGARYIVPLAGPGVQEQPIYLVPSHEAYNITLDGQSLAGSTGSTDSLGIFGPGLAVTAQNLELEKGDKHQLTFSADAQKISFVAGNSRVKPTFNVATSLTTTGSASSTGLTSYLLKVGNINVTKGQQLDLSVNRSSGELNVQSSVGLSVQSSYDLSVTRSTQNGTQSFNKTGVKLLGGDVQHLTYGSTTTTGQLNINIDHGGNGTVDATQSVPSVPTAQP